MDTPQEISEFFDFILEHIEKQKEQTIYCKEVQKLEGDLDNARIININLNKNFKENLKKDESNINVKYVELQERHDYYKKNIKILQEKFEQMKIAIKQENTEMAKDAELNKKREEEFWKKKIEEVKREIEKRKLNHAKKVEQLNNELTMAQAKADLELDEIETDLRRELIDLNAKIWRQKKANTDIKTQIEDLKKRPQQPTNMCQNMLQPDDLSFFQLDDIGDFFNDKNQKNVATNNNTEQPQHQPTNKYKYALNNDLVSKNNVRAYNSKYKPLDINIFNKHVPLGTYNNNEEQRHISNITRTTKSTTLPKTTDFYNIETLKKESPGIMRTIATTSSNYRNFASSQDNSENSTNNKVQFMNSRTNDKPNEETNKQHTPKNSPNFFNLELMEEMESLTNNFSCQGNSSRIKMDIGQSRYENSNRKTKKVDNNKQHGTSSVMLQNQRKTILLEKGEGANNNKPGNQKNPPKKRKLFDPDDLDYLDEILGQNIYHLK